jgi:hypothetical protein
MSTDPIAVRHNDPVPMGWQRAAALSGLAFGILFVVGFLMLAGDTPDYTAADQEWIDWADDNESGNRIAVLLILLAGAEFLWYSGVLRSALGEAEIAARGFTRIAYVAFAGAIVGIAGIVMACVMVAAASLQGADVSPDAARAITDAAAGPFLLASVGFAVFLAASGVLVRRMGPYAGWTGIVALVGSVAFLLTLLTVLGDSDDSVFGVGFPIGFLALVIFAIATSIENHRRVTTTAV